jgi:long-chain acyl-CoA synthetase
MLDKLNSIKSKLPNVKTVIVMDPKAVAQGALKLKDVIDRGKALRDSGSQKVEARIKQIKDTDLFTLIYTSGTTGQPKGVMLTHKNMLFQLTDVIPVIDIGAEERMMSILPVWHIFERVFMYGSIYVGASTYFTNVRDMKDDFQKCKPTFMASAPRLWESIYTGIYSRLNDPKQTKGFQKGMFNAAYFCSKNFHKAYRFITNKEVDYEGRNPLASLVKGIIYFFQMIFLFEPSYKFSLLLLL